MGTNPYADYQDPMARAGLGQYAGYKNSSHTAGSCIAKSENCQEVKITIIVELPHSKETGWGAKGLAGHTAMAIKEDFYDYGPDYYQDKIDEKKYDADFNNDGDKNDIIDAKDLSIDYYFAPGRPWWSQSISERYGIKNVKLSDVLGYIDLDWDKDKTQIYGTVYKIEFYVKQEQADKMKKWWEERYQHLKIYSVKPWTGEQCTTTVKQALRTGGILIPSWTETPSGILEDFSAIKSTSYQHQGKAAKITMIKKEASDWPK